MWREYLGPLGLRGLPKKVPNGFRELVIDIQERHPKRAEPWLNAIIFSFHILRGGWT